MSFGRPWPTRRIRGHKYGATRCEASESWPELAGRSFASKLERTRAQELVLLLRSGHIKDLRFQVTVHLTKARVKYKPDFLYFDVALGAQVWDEAKGLETQTYLDRRRLWTVYGPGLLRVVVAGGRNGGTRLKEEISPSGSPEENACR